MQLLPMQTLGARETAPHTIDFGIYLPAIDAAAGWQVSVKVLAESDQLLADLAPAEVALSHSRDPRYGDYWSGQLEIANYPPPRPGSAWGQPGTYLYWFAVSGADARSADRIIDPFAREFGFGSWSAITIGYQPYVWSGQEANWRTPALADLIFYELQINEIGGSIQKATQLLDYLQDLGVSAIELMPIAEVGVTVDWGYSPIGYFGVDERFGNRANLQALIDEAHKRGIAVVLDVVYGHTAGAFSYVSLYGQLGLPNPVMDPGGTYGPTPRYSAALMSDLFYTVNNHWLDTCHVDGFRYDNVDAFWDGAPGNGYFPPLARATYELVEAQVQTPGSPPHWQRFASAGSSELRLIQCAEYLPDPPAALAYTYANCVWQNRTMDAAKTAAGAGPLEGLGFQFGLSGYPAQATVDGVTLSKTALQYVENHDHARFLCTFGTHFTDVLQSELLREGDRTAGADPSGSAFPDRWFMVQPYLIGLFLGKGVPFLWQGQEIGENYYVPEDWRENGRVRIFRPVRWNYAHDDPGMALALLVRKLSRIRRSGAQFRTGDHFFYNDSRNYQSKGLLLFSRQAGTVFSLVALNFTDASQTVSFSFPQGGDYREEIDGGMLLGVTAGAPRSISIPSHYGCAWTNP